MTPRNLAVECENAYHSRDRDGLHRALAQLTALATPPDFSRLTREQLEDRRTELRVQQADINDRIEAMQQAGRKSYHLDAVLRSPASLDPSE